MVTLFEYDRDHLTAVFDMQQKQRKGIDQTPKQPSGEEKSASHVTSNVEDVAMQPEVVLESSEKEQLSKEPELMVSLSPERKTLVDEPAVKSENAKHLSVESASENVVIAKDEIKVEEPLTEAEKIKREIARLE